LKSPSLPRKKKMWQGRSKGKVMLDHHSVFVQEEL
jgi:hypothetical protein